jgi:phosphoribosylformylglycinamidine synthase
VARAVVAVTSEQSAGLLALAQQHGVPAVVMGTSGGTSFVVNAPDVTFSIALDTLREVNTATLPALFDH